MQTHREEVNSKLSLVGIGQLHDEEAAVEHELRWQIAVIEAFVWHRRIPGGVQFGVAGVFEDFPRKLRGSSAEAPRKLCGSFPCPRPFWWVFRILEQSSYEEIVIDGVSNRARMKRLLLTASATELA